MAIQTKCNENSVFSFSMLSLKQIEKEIILSKLNIPTKIIKKNSNIFLNFICKGIKNPLKFSIFPLRLKYADVTLLHEMNSIIKA